MKRGAPDQEKACQKISPWVRVFASGFFFAREPFLAKKASYGSRGTVLSAADAGLKADFL
jgi:hypothetical protein